MALILKSGSLDRFEFNDSNQKIFGLGDNTGLFIGISSSEASGGGGSPSVLSLLIGAYTDNSIATQGGAVYVYDPSSLSDSPTKLAPSGLSADDFFGGAVAATSDHLIVGAISDDDGGSAAGAVYVYDASNLSSTPTKLTPSGISENDQFGVSVAGNSDYIVVGAWRDDDVDSNSGAVYVFDATNLSATPTKLKPGTLGQDFNFGSSVAINDSQIIVGAMGDNTQGGGAGAVYVYDSSNLSSSPTKLAPSGLGGLDRFGQHIAVNNNKIVVSSLGDDDQAINAGAVYVFDATNLSSSPTKLAPSSLDRDDRFGSSVAINDNQIIIGAEYDDDEGDAAGAVYVYNASNLSASPTKLAPGGLSSNDFFGHTVSANNSKIIVGAHGDDSQANFSGAVYVYDASNLNTAPTKLAPSSLNTEDRFGYSVSIS